MRIAIFSPYLYPFQVGMLETLKKLRTIQDVILFVTGIYGNYPFERLLKKTKTLKSITVREYKILTVRGLLEFINFRPHVVILFGIESIAGIMLYKVSRMLRAKAIVIVEENYITNLKDANAFLLLVQAFKRQLVRSVYKRADVLVAESKASMRYVTMVLNVKRSKPIYIRPHGISLEYFFTFHKIDPEVAKMVVIKRLSLPKEISGKIWISFVGEPSYYKGADVLLDAALALKKIFPENNYIFLFPRGLPLLRDKPELKEKYLKKLAKLIHEGVIVTYPILPSEFMPIFYKASDIVVLPSRLLPDTSSDRSPNAAIEALASGKIIVASYVGGIPDIVGEAGILIKPNDFQSLAKKIAEIMKNIQNFNHFETLCRNRARKYFDVRIYTLTLLKLLTNSSTR